MKKKSKISIITINFNNLAGLRLTVNSVLKQSYNTIEFIIIDGGSTDGSVQFLRENEQHFDYWISERDCGVYHAMNKGIARASGEWVNFMNSGDYFFNDKVLSSIAWEQYAHFSLLIGASYNRFRNCYRNPTSLKSLEYGVIPGNHQSMFFNKELLSEVLLYNEQYKVHGDYELVNRIFKRSPQSIYILETVVANYEGNGISSKRNFAVRKEKYKTILNEYGLIQCLLVMLDKALHPLHDLKRFEKLLV